MSCRPRGGRTGGPDHLTGRIPHGPVEQQLAGGRLSRCHVLWTALYGAESDFDDLRGELAVALGWVDPGGLDLSEFLTATGEFIEQCGLSWGELRRHATSVFDRLYGGDAVEVEVFDPRTWEQAVADTLFPSGGCRACGLGVPGTPREHRELAGWVLHRRITWEQIASRL